MTHSPRRVRRRRSVTSPDTLVAVLANDRDLHTFLRERTYRIPDRVLGRALARDALETSRYLALYQSGTITDGLPGAIEWWGKIADVRSMRRREVVPEEPDHPAADEVYHVLRLGRRRRRNPPLRSGRTGRFAFIRTTRKRFLGADSIDDLPLGSPSSTTLVEAVAERIDRYPDDTVGSGSGEGVPFGVGTGRRRYVRINDVGMEIDVDLYEEHEEEGSEGEMPGDRVAEGKPPGGTGRRIGIIRFSAAHVESDVESCVDQIMAALARLHTRPDIDDP